MEFDYYSPSGMFVVLTADQFVGRDDGLLEQQKQDTPLTVLCSVVKHLGSGRALKTRRNT